MLGSLWSGLYEFEERCALGSWWWLVEFGALEHSVSSGVLQYVDWMAVGWKCCNICGGGEWKPASVRFEFVDCVILGSTDIQAFGAGTPVERPGAS